MRSSRPLIFLFAASLLPVSASANPTTKAAATSAVHKQFAAKDALIADLRRRLAQALAENARLKQNAPVPIPTAETRVPVVFAEGHDTNLRDQGRPVILVAGALGVPPEVFREAFSHVRPAPAGTEPDPDQVGRNKQALLEALGKYGITNERLDTVSNYYRYVRGQGQIWPTTPATADALVRGGVVTGFVVTSGGSGYSSPPEVTVPGIPGVTVKVTLSFSPQFTENGTVTSITVVSRQ